MEDKLKEALNMGGTSQEDATLAALGLSTGISQGQELPRNPDQALQLINEALRMKLGDGGVFIIDYAEMICPASDLTTTPPAERTMNILLQSWGRDMRIASTGNIIILICQNLNDLHPAIRAGSAKYHPIEIPLPNLDKRKEYIEILLKNDEELLSLEEGLTIDQVANLTAGLSFIHIEDIFLKAIEFTGLTRDIIKEHKDKTIEGEYSGLLEILEPTISFDDIGGMETLKDWATKEIIKPIQEGRLQDSIQGALLVGNPGTGKTYFVKALARELGFNAVALNFENILGGIVGTSERNLSKALSIAKSLSPVLIFIDELDQSDIASRGNSSGNPVAKNLFSMTLRFLSEPSNRGKIIFIGASNRPDLLDPALQRSGRIDAIIPVLLPNEAEKEAIAYAQAKTQGITLDPPAAQLISRKSDKYSSADIAALITKARKIAKNKGLKTISTGEAEEALQLLRPASIANADFFTALALQACTDTEFIPKQERNKLDDREALEAKIETLQPRKRREL